MRILNYVIQRTNFDLFDMIQVCYEERFDYIKAFIQFSSSLRKDQKFSFDELNSWFKKNYDKELNLHQVFSLMQYIGLDRIGIDVHKGCFSFIICRSPQCLYYLINKVSESIHVKEDIEPTEIFKEYPIEILISQALQVSRTLNLKLQPIREISGDLKLKLESLKFMNLELDYNPIGLNQ